MDAPRTVTLGEALARAAAAGEPIQQKEATAIFLEALRLADQTQATLSSARMLLREDGALELAPGNGEAAHDPFGPVSGAYELADELFRGAAPLALGRGDGSRATPFATLRDLLCSLEFHLLVESGRGGPPPPARSDCRRAILRLLAVSATGGAPPEKLAQAPEARRDLIRTFEQVAAAKREAGEPEAGDDERSGLDRAPARSAVEWTPAAPPAAAPPPAAPAPAPPAAAAPAPPAAAAPAPPANPPAAAQPPAAAVPAPGLAPPPPEAPPVGASAAPQQQAGGAARGSGRSLVIALIVGASIAGAIAAASRSPPGPGGRPSSEPRPPPAVPSAGALGAAAHREAPAPEVAAIGRAGPSRAAAPVPTGQPGSAPWAAQEPLRGGDLERGGPGAGAQPADPAAEARARAKVRLGEGLLKSGQVFQALVAFREADQEVPLPESARRLGDIYRLQHDDALAAAAYRRCLRLSPSAADARAVRAILRELRRAAPAAE